MKLNKIFLMFMLFFAIDAHASSITTTLPIKKVILWGHKLHSHTHSYIHWGFKRAFEHLGYDTYWFDNKDDVSKFDFSNSLFITEGQVDQKMPLREDCFYILHNCTSERYKPLYPTGRAISLQVYTNDCLRYNLTKVDECIYCDVDSAAFYMPWATDLLPHEIEANKEIIRKKKNEAVFIGSIGGGKFGNKEHIEPFKKAAAENKIDFYHKIHLSMEDNISRVQNAYMAPAIQGSWQVAQGYIPCRIFKNISYGAFGITNCLTVYNLFDKKIVYNADCYQLFYDAKKKLDNLDIAELHELMDFVKTKHTYINRIELLLGFMQTVYARKQGTTRAPAAPPFQPSGYAPLKVLHLSLHKGCINDFAEVSRELGLDTTDWYIHDAREQFDPQAVGNDIYNITAERAERVWQLNKDYFHQFDVIVTSDTGPLSRIFLQNDWKKPLVIWICNRFDYYDAATAKGKFPDKAYYELFRSAINMPNVTIISYTPYEHFYAHQKGVHIGTQTIRPIGSLPKETDESFVSGIPKSVKKSETIFIYPRMDKEQSAHIQKKCAELGITAHYGTYNGPDDLTDFKGILYFPYAWSNLALFENIQRGIVHFVPTERFIKEMVKKEPVPHFTMKNFHLCDWYCDEYKDLFVYFDSWQDLKQKINNTDYAAMHAKIKKAGLEHWQKNLNLWRDLFESIAVTPDNAPENAFR